MGHKGGVNGSEIDARFFEGDGFNFAFSWLIDTLGINVEIILCIIVYIENRYIFEHSNPCKIAWLNISDKCIH